MISLVKILNEIKIVANFGNDLKKLKQRLGSAPEDSEEFKMYEKFKNMSTLSEFIDALLNDLGVANISTDEEDLYKDLSEIGLSDNAIKYIQTKVHNYINEIKIVPNSYQPKIGDKFKIKGGKNIYEIAEIGKDFIKLNSLSIETSGLARFDLDKFLRLIKDKKLIKITNEIKILPNNNQIRIGTRIQNREGDIYELIDLEGWWKDIITGQILYANIDNISQDVKAKIIKIVKESKIISEIQIEHPKAGDIILIGGYKEKFVIRDITKDGLIIIREMWGHKKFNIDRKKFDDLVNKKQIKYYW